MILYYGVLAPRAAWRAGVVPRRVSTDAGGLDEHGGLDEPSAADERARASAHRDARGYLWAELMRRTFGFDVLACPRCGGRLRLVALIEEAAVIDRILRHVGVPTEVPTPRPARAPPECARHARHQPGWLD